jgi:hypothetical protein
METREAAVGILARILAQTAEVNDLPAIKWTPD